MRSNMNKNKLMQWVRSFRKETRGSIDMEYIFLGAFAVAACLVAVMLVGWVHTQTLNRTSNATVANVNDCMKFKGDIKYKMIDSVEGSEDYTKNITDPPTTFGMGYKEFDLETSLGFKLDD